MPDPANGSQQLTIETTDRLTISGELSGSSLGAGGPPIVLLHGLTATRRYVLMGSHALERSGRTVISYDARGHGRSAGASGLDDYGYERLTDDLARLLDDLDVPRAILAGASMGAHTAVRFALERPERVVGLMLITPAFDPGSYLERRRLSAWDALAQGLREGGVDGFLDAYDLDALPEQWRQTVGQVIRQRMSLHQHPDAVADALQGVPRSAAFRDLRELEGIAVPTIVVASRDEADPGHPLVVGEEYARRIPGARLLVEPDERPPRSPIAWQGGQLSRALTELADDVHSREGPR